MYGNILLPFDNSPCSRQALSWATCLARRLKSHLVGLHVYNANFHECAFQKMEAGLPERYQKDEVLKEQRMIHDALITKGLQLIADSFLNVLSDRCQREEVSFEEKMAEGKNFAQILKEADNDQYDLVILGAYGLGQDGSPTLGSVCQRTARHLRKDILVVKGGFPKEGAQVLVAVDGSRNSFTGLSKGLFLARSFGWRIKAVAVFDPDFHRRAFANISQALTSEAAKIFRLEEQKALHETIIDGGLRVVAERHLKKAQALARAQGIELVTQVAEGKPYREILKAIEQEGPGLLITGRYGSHGSTITDIGSHTENLLLYSGVSQLIVEDSLGEAEITETEIQEEIPPLEWDEAALTLLDRIPSFARGMAKAAVEKEARERGLAKVTEDLIWKARARWEGKKEVAEPSESSIQWTEGALKRLEKVPEFSRDMAKFRIGVFAAKKGYTLITEEVLEERYAGWAEEMGKVEPDPSLGWTEQARSRVDKIPEHIRPVVIKEIEALARRQGMRLINEQLLETAKKMWDDFETFHQSHKEPKG